jgi:hypothetical protein
MEIAPMGRKLFAFRRRHTPKKWTEEWVDQTYARAVEKIRNFIGEKLETLPPDSNMRAYLERLQGLPDEKLFEEMWARVPREP